MLQDTIVNKHPKTTFVNFYGLWTKIINVLGLAQPNPIKVALRPDFSKKLMHVFSICLPL